MKRVFLFVATNLGVLIALSVVAHLLGLSNSAGGQNLDLGSLLAFAALFGFGGAFFSLAISKWSARKAVGARVIELPATSEEIWLLDTVERHSALAGIRKPEVAIYESEEVNAFATGMTRNKALVAVSTGLLQRMTRDEAEAVIGHEISHIANGDMVTLALIQGVLNTFVIFLARVVGWLVDRLVFRNEEGPGVGYYVTFFVLEIGLGVLASGVVMWFSRRREFSADEGGATLAGRHKMIAALEHLRSVHDSSHLPDRMVALGIAGSRKGDWKTFFSSHPPIEARIAALRAAPGVTELEHQHAR